MSRRARRASGTVTGIIRSFNILGQIDTGVVAAREDRGGKGGVEGETLRAEGDGLFVVALAQRVACVVEPAANAGAVESEPEDRALGAERDRDEAERLLSVPAMSAGWRRWAAEWIERSGGRSREPADPGCL